FTDHTYDHLSMAPRKFNSISDAAKEAGLSRLFGGIHYRRSIEQGLELGRNTAAIVDNHLKKQNYFPE
ncbi:haloperoxidase, partial [Flavihumibacter sediminis]|nr:haloperoxidase [Flavihumibacter sediminis]